MSTHLDEKAAVLVLTKASPGEWYRTADIIAEAGSATTLLDGRPHFYADEQQHYADELVGRANPDDLKGAAELIERMAGQGIRLITVLDNDYPANLRLIYNRPPFIWVRGDLQPQDFKAIAVVGTRKASDHGLVTASHLARELASAKVTVMSGLARGIDTAAHSAALDAGGRTVAVIGNGLNRPVYPKENGDLAVEITRQGAVVSQFWPDAPPRKTHFPMRNVVMSGLAMGTVVVEASATSGAKMQARLCLEHGKRLFLLESLVSTQPWAQRYRDRPGVTVVHEIDDILDVLVQVANTPKQLMLQV